MKLSPPDRVRPTSFRRWLETPDDGLEVAVAIDAQSHAGSRLVFGMLWIRPGTERVSWQADDDTYEAYYVHTGSLFITWSGSTTGESEVHQGECFYYAPGTSYTMANAGTTDVFVVWAITPVMPGAAA